MNDGPLLRVTDVSKEFGGVRALHSVNLEVKQEQICLVIGPNGSGKTTLVNIICGVLPPDEGHVLYDSTDITRWPPHRIYSRGLVRTFQIAAPFTSLTVLENMLVAERISGGESFWGALFKRKWLRQHREAQERAFSILDLLGLAELWDVQASKLSGGQLKLLETGRALMGGAKMILMDEPVAGVNPTLAHEIFAQIRSLRKELRVTFLFIEHRLEIALRYADFVYVFDRGVVISKGTVAEVMKDEQVIKTYLGVG